MSTLQGSPKKIQGHPQKTPERVREALIMSLYKLAKGTAGYPVGLGDIFSHILPLLGARSITSWGVYPDGRPILAALIRNEMACLEHQWLVEEPSFKVAASTRQYAPTEKLIELCEARPDLKKMVSDRERRAGDRVVLRSYEKSNAEWRKSAALETEIEEAQAEGMRRLGERLNKRTVPVDQLPECFGQHSDLSKICARCPISLHCLAQQALQVSYHAYLALKGIAPDESEPKIIGSFYEQINARTTMGFRGPEEFSENELELLEYGQILVSCAECEEWIEEDEERLSYQRIDGLSGDLRRERTQTFFFHKRCVPEGDYQRAWTRRWHKRYCLEVALSKASIEARLGQQTTE